MTEIEEARSRLSPAKQALLEKRLRGALEPRALGPTIPRLADRTAVPLSFAQQRMWFFQQWEAHDPVYNRPLALRLQGDLDVPGLAWSLNEILRRHEVLRTVFPLVNGEPVQRVLPATELPLPVEDLTHLPTEDRAAVAQRLMDETIRQPFELETAPPVRARLFRLSADDHVLLFVAHHIVLDGWSETLFVNELCALYGSFQTNQTGTLPELPIQYADFAHWQRASVQDETLKAQVAYWRGKLGGPLPVLDLPTDRPRPPVQTFHGAMQPLVLSRSLVDELVTISRQEGVTLFMTLLAAFKLMLYRHTGQTDIIVGTLVAGRSQTETEKLIGVFVNTLVLRTDLAGNPTLRELLHLVRQTSLGAYANQDLPFDMLVAELNPERDLSRTPVFQVLFNLENLPDKAKRAGDVQVAPYDLDTDVALFDLSVELVQRDGETHGAFVYNTGLFDAMTIQRMAGHFQTLLEGIVADPSQRISGLPLLTKAERHQLLVEWNETQAEYPRDLGVHRLFEAQVERTPDAVAVVFENEKLTYRELNRKANQLAGYLHKLGVGPDALVGLCVERSLEMVVGVLGILKAGGAYLPLDPTYPRQRLAFMMADAQVPVLLAQKKLIAELPDHTARVVCLDADWETVGREGIENLDSGVGADNLAYVIYTSGSTGMPKGVCIPHSALTNFLSTMRTRPGLQSSDTLAALSAMSFDIAGFELFLPLIVGAEVVVVGYKRPADAQRLRETLEGCRPTVIQATPSTWRMLLQVGWAGGADIKALSGGETLPRELADELLPRVGELWNLYGPTETTIYSLDGEVSRSVDSVPIGRPIANTQVYLLDSRLQPVPIGVPGELYIGGDGLARGYLRRPELTAERFIPHPFADQPGSRLYRTGDLARYSSDGAVEFLGRVDFQVKIRGFRIELGEIETVLEQHPAVRQCVVLAREDTPGDSSAAPGTGRRLVAYIVPKQMPGPTVSELRSFLKEKLPEYMLPPAFVFLDALPLTPNGKVDRAALPAPEPLRPELERAFVAPRTPAEVKLAEIWAKVLNLERVGVYDNFFELGGHSLLATQVVSRIRDTFRMDLPLRSIFDTPTVAGLCTTIETLAGRAAPTPAVTPITRAQRSVQPATERVTFPASFGQQGLWFLDQLEPQSPLYNVAWGFHISGALDLSLIERALAAIIARHEVLRTTLSMYDGEPVQIISPTGAPALTVIDLRHLPQAGRDREVRRLIREEARHPFDLARGPLFRSLALRLSDQEHVLLFVTHHAIVDEWSVGILCQELASLYVAFMHGRPSPLPDLPIQYADFAQWQREGLRQDVLQAQLAYWRRQLGGELPLLDLPYDRPRTVQQTFHGDTQSFELPHALSAALDDVTRREGVTMFMLLLAAFDVLLHRYTGQDDILVGSPFAARKRVETEPLIGFFLNTLVLRTDLSGDPSFRQLLRRVREVALGGYANLDIPFESVVAGLQPERDLSHSPLFHVMFVVQNPQPPLMIPGLAATAFDVETGTAKFDLTLFLKKSEDRLSGIVEYNTDLFEPATIARLVGHFQTLLESIVADPDTPISQLSLLSAGECQQLLHGWNDTGADYPSSSCVHELVEAQVEHTPGAVAVMFEERRLTYRDLNQRANHLAHELRRLGVGPDVLVGICMDRSIEMMVALLAVLKAGGAYVALDPNYPKERLAFMLEDARCPVILTQTRLAPGLPGRQAHLICLDGEWSRPDEGQNSNPSPSATPANLTYVMYTSGSTGTPKAVAMTHRSLSNLLAWQLRSFSFSRAARTLQFASLSFDVSFQEIFSTWLAGGTLLLTTEKLRRDMVALLRFVRDQAVERIFLPFVALQHLAEAAESFGLFPSGLREIVTAGEQLQITPAIARLCRELASCVLHNQYGPAESHVVTFYTLSGPPEGWPALPPIGRPIANTQIYILDSHLQPVPVGVTGELYIGGVGLARGYWNRPDLTAERFVASPFEIRPGSRLYKTGDLGRYRPDGNIEFLGRNDDQVKIRGYRVELGEIEAVLSRHPSVRDCVVAAREDTPGNKIIVAYLVPQDAATLAPHDVRRFLKLTLPDFMIPSAFVLMDSLPLTPSGKVDRRTLTAPNSARPSLEVSFVAPRTPVEQRVAAIWCEVFHVAQVGLYDNFFDLGGHSLRAMQVISRLRDAFHIELPLHSIFEMPTVAGLCTAIEGLVRQTAGTAPIMPIARQERRARRGVQSESEKTP